MSAIASFLLKVLGNKIAQQIIIIGLETAAKRSDNTVDDQVVKIVKEGLSNRVNPVTRVVGK